MESRYGRRIRPVHVPDTAFRTTALVQLVVAHPAITNYKRRIRVCISFTFYTTRNVPTVVQVTPSLLHIRRRRPSIRRIQVVFEEAHLVLVVDMNIKVC
jgi:hypothetical protein